MATFTYPGGILGLLGLSSLTDWPNGSKLAIASGPNKADGAFWIVIERFGIEGRDFQVRALNEDEFGIDVVAVKMDYWVT